MVLDLGQRRRQFALLFFTRIIRLFSYGMLPVVFFKILTHKHFSQLSITQIQSGIVFGDIFISLILTTQADRFGRLNTLMVGAMLKLVTGVIYAYSDNFVVLLISGILGVISVSGGEIGPFMPVEQSSLTQILENSTKDKTTLQEQTALLFGQYNMVGYIAQACGAVFAGLYVTHAPIFLQEDRETAVRQVVLLFGLLGGVMVVAYYCMRERYVQAQILSDRKVIHCTGLKKENIGTIITLSVLFSLDAFAGGFVIQSFLAFYYQKKYYLHFDQIGGLFFVCNIISGVSGIVSAKFVRRCGAMATMIYTHLPSNVLLLLIGFTDNATLSITLLIARFCISQMDVPARQTYVSMVVSSSERSAANGITNIARSVGLCAGMAVTGVFLSATPSDRFFSMPFIIAGVLKIVYDVTIGCCFLWNKRRETVVDNITIEEKQIEMSSQPSEVEEKDK